MTEPTSEDAIRLLTDPANQVPGQFGGGMVEMRAAATIGGLRDMGMTEERAVELIRAGLDRLGGDLVEDSVPLYETGEDARSGVRHQPMRRIDVPESELRTD